MLGGWALQYFRDSPSLFSLEHRYVFKLDNYLVRVYASMNKLSFSVVYLELVVLLANNISGFDNFPDKVKLRLVKILITFIVSNLHTQFKQRGRVKGLETTPLAVMYKWLVELHCDKAEIVKVTKVC